MEPSFVLLAVGLLLSFVDTLLGRRNRQGGEETPWERARFAWGERRWTVIGALLVIGSLVLQAVGH